MAQQQAVNKFVLGSKELEGKNAEFQYDKGWYSITDIVGEERNVIYKSRNAQEAYMKWNVYIGRKKERPVPENRKNDNGADRGEHRDLGRNNQREKRNNRDNREIREERESQEGWDNRGGRSRENRDNRNQRDNRDRRDRDRGRNRDREEFEDGKRDYQNRRRRRDNRRDRQQDVQQDME